MIDAGEVFVDHKVKVMIVEEESIIAEDLRMKIENRGYEVCGIARSGRQAIDVGIRTKPDVVLMDIRISGDLNGVETAIILQGKSETPLPIVFVTAFSSELFPVLKAVECFSYINKPFSDQQLFSAIDSAFQLVRNR